MLGHLHHDHLLCRGLLLTGRVCPRQTPRFLATFKGHSFVFIPEVLVVCRTDVSSDVIGRLPAEFITDYRACTSGLYVEHDWNGDVAWEYRVRVAQ